LEKEFVEHGAVVCHRLATTQLRVLAERVVRGRAIRRPQTLANLVELVDVASIQTEVRLELVFREGLDLPQEITEILRLVLGHVLLRDVPGNGCVRPPHGREIANRRTPGPSRKCGSAVDFRTAKRGAAEYGRATS